MQEITEKDLINQLKNEDNASFEVLYQRYFPPVKAYIAGKSGGQEDAEDIFQETIIVLLQKIRQPDFALTSTLKTYLVAIAKNLWLKRLRDNKLLPVGAIENYHRGVDNFSVEIVPEKTKEEKLGSWLSKITAHCQRILKAIFFYKDTMNNLSEKIGWKNKHSAANQKYKCIEQVRKESRK